MGSTSDKTAGVINQGLGKAKQALGKTVGSERLAADGAAQETRGDVQKATGDAKATIKDGVNKAANSINRNL